MKNNSISKYLVFVLVLVCILYGRNLNTWNKNRIIQNDVISYYAYLPATFIFHDLNFEFVDNLPENFEGEIWLQDSPTGKPMLRMTMGLAVLWTPFFFLGHGLAKICGVSTLGYSWPYSLSIFIAAIFYLFIGLLFLRKILIRYFSDLLSALTILILVVGTNLMFYVISEPGMTHVYNFALICVFMFYSIRWIEQFSFYRAIVLGILYGLIILIRPVNAVVVIFPALLGISGFNEIGLRLKKYWKGILLSSLLAFIIVLPQLIYWKIQTGHFLFNSYMESGKFYFFRPQIMNGLFSYRKGWLIYTPVMVFTIAGFFIMKKYAGIFRFPVILIFLIHIYVIFSWWCWWYGGSFGSRPMIDIYGLLSLPMAAFFEWIWKKKFWLKAGIAVLLFVFISLNQFQMSQYRTSLLHWDSMTKEAYWGIFLKKSWPEGYNKMIQTPDYEKALNGQKEY